MEENSEYGHLAHESVIQGGASFASIDGVAAAYEASYKFADWLSVDCMGDIVVFEDFGGIDSARFLAAVSLEEFKKLLAQRRELMTPY